MDVEKKKQLEAKLRDMFNAKKEDSPKRVLKRTQPAVNKVIRRRKGEQEKRIPLAG